MEEAIHGGALGGARHRDEPERRKSLAVDGGWLRGQRGTPHWHGTQGGAGRSSQQPKEAAVGGASTVEGEQGAQPTALVITL
jgi:hypothetical protein